MHHNFWFVFRVRIIFHFPTTSLQVGQFLLIYYRWEEHGDFVSVCGSVKRFKLFRWCNGSSCKVKDWDFPANQWCRSIINYESSIINHLSSIIYRQSSIVNHLSTINYQLSSIILSSIISTISLLTTQYEIKKLCPLLLNICGNCAIRRNRWVKIQLSKVKG